MKLNELEAQIHGGAILCRDFGPIVKLNTDDMSLWYYNADGEKLFPITFGDMIADDWKVVG